MHNSKSFLRHEILNIVTVLNFLIIDTNLSTQKKQEILEHLKMIGTLNAEEAFILGEKSAFSREEIDLNEALQIIFYMVEAQAQKSKCNVNLNNTNLIIQSDFEALKNGLENILLALIKITKNIDLSVDESKKTLKIEYNSDQIFSIKEGDLLAYLKEKHETSEIFCKIYTDLMRANGIKISFKKNEMNIIFP